MNVASPLDRYKVTLPNLLVLEDSNQFDPQEHRLEVTKVSVKETNAGSITFPA